MADLQEFKQKYPDIYAAVHEEGKAAGYEAGLEAGRVAGRQEAAEVAAEETRQAAATAERERIMAVREQLIPGHEALIETMMFDGKTSGPEAAVKVLAAEKSAREATRQQLQADAPEPLPEAPVSALEPAAPKADDDELPLDEKCKAAWDQDSKLRVEFDGDYESYLAAEKAAAAGVVRVISGKDR
jgi:hypothetical protein